MQSRFRHWRFPSENKQNSDPRGVCILVKRDRGGRIIQVLRIPGVMNTMEKIKAGARKKVWEVGIILNWIDMKALAVKLEFE